MKASTESNNWLDVQASFVNHYKKTNQMEKKIVDTPYKDSWADSVNKTDWKTLQPKTNHVFLKSITLEEYRKNYLGITEPLKKE